MASMTGKTGASHSFSRFRQYRWKEFGLFLIPFTILLLETIQLFLAHQDSTSTFSTKSLPTLQGLTPTLGLIVLFLGINVLLSFFFPKADQVLLPLVGLMSGLGILMATRLGPDIGDSSLGNRQLLWVIIGVAACLFTLFGLRNMNWLRRYKYTWAFLGIAMVSLTVANALRVKNLNSPTHDQLKIGPFALQPSELLKIFLVIFFAAYLSENIDIFREGSFKVGRFRLPPFRQLGPLVVMLGLALLLFLVVRELGLALLIYGIFLTMIYLGTNKISYVIVSLIIFVVLGFVGYTLFGYVRDRFAVVGLNVVNWSAANDYIYQHGGFQVVQGLIALTSGGILGSGFGLGHPAFVPVIESDMVFTAFGEEFGLAGLFGLIGVYLLIVYRGYRIAIEARDSFNQILAAGLTSIFAIQTIIITAGNMKFLPLTGIPLPFLSYGGSSIIGNFIIIGILLRISHNTAMEREGLA